MSIRLFKEHCNAFIRFAEKEFAARAIFEMNGADVGGLGLKLKCNWGKSEVGPPYTKKEHCTTDRWKSVRTPLIL